MRDNEYMTARFGVAGITAQNKTVLEIKTG
jgi:hypothetical protein